jgi:hypothetical protein
MVVLSPDPLQAAISGLRSMAPKKPAAPAASDTHENAPKRGPGAGQFRKGQSGNPAGRPRGIVDRYRMLRAEQRAKMADEAGCTPLQFLLSIMLDESQETAIRLRAATDAAPYFHARCATKIEVEGQLGHQLDLHSIAALTAEDRKVFLVLIEKMGIAI